MGERWGKEEDGGGLFRVADVMACIEEGVRSYQRLNFGLVYLSSMRVAFTVSAIPKIRSNTE